MGAIQELADFLDATGRDHWANWVRQLPPMFDQDSAFAVLSRLNKLPEDVDRAPIVREAVTLCEPGETLDTYVELAMMGIAPEPALSEPALSEPALSEPALSEPAPPEPAPPEIESARAAIVSCDGFSIGTNLDDMSTSPFIAALASQSDTFYLLVYTKGQYQFQLHGDDAHHLYQCLSEVREAIIDRAWEYKIRSGPVAASLDVEINAVTIGTREKVIHIPIGHTFRASCACVGWAIKDMNEALNRKRAAQRLFADQPRSGAS